MKDLIQKAKVIVCVGSGGVGKTTVASALGYLGALQGKKVLVLTVDPAQRLKTTMGLADKESAKIEIPGAKGTLTASVIDPKKTFDEFVLRAAVKEESARKILDNKLYIQLSTTLSGSQEFTALEKLYSSYLSGQYDLIILDTPPTKHAIDFLQAPEKLSTLFKQGIAKWFKSPEHGGNILVSLLHTGTKQVLKILENLTGSDFMKELSAFFTNIDQWRDKLEQRTVDVHRLLTSTETHFCLVTSFDEAKLKEAEYFFREIRKGGYQLSSMIINRAYPSWFDKDVADNEIPASELGDLYKKIKEFYANREQVFDKFSQRMRSQGQIVRLPELPEGVSDLQGVQMMADLL